MSLWENRSPEIANLLNPPFCSLVMYSTIKEYQQRSEANFPFTLMYLILPIVLHKQTRESLESRTNMIVWLQKNPQLLIGFSFRARSLTPFTNESIEFMLLQNLITITSDGVKLQNTISKTRLKQFISYDDEIESIIKKAEHLGRWFVNMGSEENIYAAWGVRP